MPKEWTGDLVGLMHNHRISNSDLAAELGVTPTYVSMVLNSRKEPPDAEHRFFDAAFRIVKRRAEGSE